MQGKFSEYMILITFVFFLNTFYSSFPSAFFLLIALNDDSILFWSQRGMKGCQSLNKDNKITKLQGKNYYGPNLTINITQSFVNHIITAFCFLIFLVQSFQISRSTYFYFFRDNKLLYFDVSWCIYNDLVSEEEW